MDEKAFRCQLILGIGNANATIPQTSTGEPCQVVLHVKVIKRDFAPALRLIATFSTPAARHKVYLDFNFCSVKGIKGQAWFIAA